MTQSSTSDEWRNLPWKKFQRVVFRLQKRIFNATRRGDMVAAKRLQKLLLSSYAARMLAIRQVTQLNQGKATAGVDGVKSLNFKQRFALERLLATNVKKWEHSKLRRVLIPKKNGKMRTLKIPTMKDRAWQCLLKYALEPAHEATFHERSYGFRPGRSTHDCQKIAFLNLKSDANGYQKRVLEIDIEKCFDRISHDSILERLICPKFVSIGLNRCLKAGVNIEFPEQGTPQGGVISPLLANVALNGIEAIGNGIRYADDMIYFIKPGESEEALLGKIKAFLAERGMNISAEKTKVTTTQEGFNFLGWEMKVQTNRKFRSTPSTENFKKFRDKVKALVANSSLGPEALVAKLAPLVRGWREYHKYCKLDGSRFSLWHLSYSVYKRLMRAKNMTNQKAIALAKRAFPEVGYSENKFVNVRGDKTPFDGDMLYWTKRNSKLYDGPSEKAIKKQDYRCAQCGLMLMEGENVHLHHVDGNHHNWKPLNLQALHHSCHQYEHMSRAIASS